MAKPQFTARELTDRLFPIYWYRKHLDVACRDLLGLELSPHHSLILRDWGRGKPVNLLFSSRGMGKSVLMAIFYLLMAVLYPNLKMIAVAGQGYRGSKFILMECERIIEGYLSGQKRVKYIKKSLRDRTRIIFKDPAYWSIQFSNGSIIYGIPLGASTDGSNIRGLRAHIIGQDEAFLIPTKLYQSVLDPMSNVLYDPTKPADKQQIKNMTLAVSTADYSFRDFYLQYEYYKSVLETEEQVEVGLKKLTKEDISVFEFNIDDAYYTRNGERVPTWGLDYDRMLKKRNSPTTDINLWNAENKNIPLNLQGGYFPFESIEAGQNVVLKTATEQYPEALDSCSGQCILGIDTAPSGDNTAFVVIKAGPYNYVDKDVEKCKTANMGKPCPILGVGRGCTLTSHAQVIFAYEENKMSQQDRIKLIYELMSRYNIISIAMDARGGGLELSDLLADPEFIKQSIHFDAKPIFDPERRPEGKGMPILTLYSTTQEQNMLFNGYLKGIITNQVLLFPKPLRDRPDNPRILEIAGHVETLTNQVARIKAIPSGKGIKFDIESIDPNTGRRVPGKKDLYSALLYACGKMRDLVEVQLSQSDFSVDDLPLPAAFNM